MLGFIVTGHGSFAPGLAGAISMVAGDQPEFEIVPFMDASAETFGDELSRAISLMAQRASGVIVFADLLGGTPFNQAMLASQNLPQVRVVAGTNLPMLIETLFMRNANETMTPDEAVSLALEAGQGGIVSKQLNVSAQGQNDDFGAQDTVDDFDGEGL